MKPAIKNTPSLQPVRATAPVPQQVTPMQEVMGRQNALLDELASQIEILHQRLNPVLSPQAPGEAQATNQVSAYFGLCADLETNNARLVGSLRYIEDIRSRLQL